MERTALLWLKDWLTSSGRKPLVIRGARQVGKTWLVRRLVESVGRQLIETNLEKQPEFLNLLASNDPKEILLNLGVALNCEINPENCLLFLDEIQSAPQLLAKLRWFAEDMPQLPVIAAGSLLEFVLAEHSFSMPVGRIGYMHIEPLSFEEFLLASDKKSLHDYLLKDDFKTAVLPPIHDLLTQSFKEYVLIGGMPAVVANWIKERSPAKANQLQHDLLATWRDDFTKYRGRVAIERLDEIMQAIPKMLGQKFVYSRVNQSISSTVMKNTLDLLTKARVCHKVSSTSANGVPLAAEIRQKYFKAVFLDTGLCCAAFGLNLNQINAADELIMVNQGGIAEQVTSQILRTIDPYYIEPALYYWHRDEKGSSAEIDYVIQHGSQVIPIEVKAGTTGSLKSLHLFMGGKKLPVAVRIYSGPMDRSDIRIKDHTGKLVKYELLSLPFYLAGQIHRLLDSKRKYQNPAK